MPRKRRRTGGIIVEELDDDAPAPQPQRRPAAPAAGGGAGPAAAAAAAPSPAGVSRADHRETSDAAIRDIAHVLRALAPCCLPPGAPPSQLRLWDPYYCQGTVKVHYARHGFPLCHNKREDFYAVARRGSLPPHDVLATNPPFSADHIERALGFCAGNGVPWVMLLPSNVLGREWWGGMAVRLQRGGAAAPPMFLAPATSPYGFDHRRPSGGGAGPKSARGAKQKKGHAPSAAPLETIWFIGGLEPAWARALRESFESAPPEQCVLAVTEAELPLRIQQSNGGVT